MNLLLILVSFVSAIILLVTAVARLNDLDLHRIRTIKGYVRGAGMVCVGVASVFYVLAPFYGHEVMSIHLTVLLIGMALSWITTPNQPPWWRYITRGDIPSSDPYTGIERRRDYMDDDDA